MSSEQYPYRLLRLMKASSHRTVIRRAKARPRWSTAREFGNDSCVKHIVEWTGWQSVVTEDLHCIQQIEHNVNSELTWSVAVNLSLITTPSAVMLRTWQMSRQGGRNVTDLLRAQRPVNMISFDSEQFNFRIFSSSQVLTSARSYRCLSWLLERWRRRHHSAYLTSTLPCALARCQMLWRWMTLDLQWTESWITSY